MTRLQDRLKALIRSQKGESLVESVVSLLIFTVLMVTVTLMINTAMAITANTTVAAKESQDEANGVILDDMVDVKTLELSYAGTGGSKTVSIAVRVSDGGAFMAFTPR